VREAHRLGKLAIATLNYDLSIEQAAQADDVPVETGIDYWIKTGRWSWPDEGIRLLKLHGSINWFFAEQKAPGHLPRDVVEVTEQSRDPRRPALLFGQRGKLQAEGPFLGLLAQFESELASAHQLVVIGYSFRDNHVNDVIRRWTAEDIDRRILVIDPCWPRTFSQEMPGTVSDFRTQLHTHLAGNATRGLPARVLVWRIRCSDALRKLRDGPPDQIDRELSQRLRGKPRVIAVNKDGVDAQPDGLEFELALTPMPPGWEYSLMDGVQSLRETAPQLIRAYAHDQQIVLCVAQDTSPSEAQQLIAMLIDATQSQFESKLDQRARDLELSRERAHKFREELRAHDPDGRILDVEADRNAGDTAFLFTVGVSFPADVDGFQIGSSMIAALTAQGRPGSDIRVGQDRVTFRESALAADEFLPLLDRGVNDARQLTVEYSSTAADRAERQRRFVDELQSLLDADAPKDRM
jgi:hypothetical protein